MVKFLKINSFDVEKQRYKWLFKSQKEMQNIINKSNLPYKNKIKKIKSVIDKSNAVNIERLCNLSIYSKQEQDQIDKIKKHHFLINSIFKSQVIREQDKINFVKNIVEKQWNEPEDELPSINNIEKGVRLLYEKNVRPVIRKK